MARVTTAAIGLGLQVIGLYAAFTTFGVWGVLGLYSIGGLAAVLQYRAARGIR